MGASIDMPMDIWGHRFTWTSKHKPAADIAPLLYSYDKLATDALDRLDEISPPKSKTWKCPHGSGEGQRDLYALVKEHAGTDELLGQLWNEISTVPEWVDWEQIQRGQRLVYQFNLPIMLGLLYKSLLGGMSAWRVVETLSRTGGFGVRVTQRRLLETLQHFVEVVEDLNSIKPGGKGFLSSVRVRLLHASVRRRLMQLEHQNPGYFDIDEFGVPINDLHCIGTVSVYSTAIIYMALPRQGIFWKDQQIRDYLALWRWIGYLMGAPVDWMTTPAAAKAMMESIMVIEVNPSENSRILANNILTAEADIPPLYAPRELLVAQAYQLNGSVLARGLGIEEPRWYWRLFAWIQCAVLILLCYSYPWAPGFYRRHVDQKFREITHTMIFDKKFGGIGEPTKFNFQYMPRVGKLTELGLYDSLATAKSASWLTKGPGKAILLVSMAFAFTLVAGYVLHVGATSLLTTVSQSWLSSVVAKPQVLQSLG